MLDCGLSFITGCFVDLMLLALFIVAYCAACLSAIAGFGSALILISAASLMFDIKWSIAITTFFYCFNSSLKTYHLYRHIDWPLVIKLSVFAIPGTFLGAYCLLMIDATWLMLGLASIALSYLLLDVLKLMPPFKLNNKILLAAGFVYGFISGAIGSGSLIKAIVFKQIRMPKEAFVASMAASALPLNIVKLWVFIGASLVVIQDVPTILVLLLASYLGTLMGKRLLTQLSQALFEHLVRAVLLLLCIGLIYRALL